MAKGIMNELIMKAVKRSGLDKVTGGYASDDDREKEGQAAETVRATPEKESTRRKQVEEDTREKAKKSRRGPTGGRERARRPEGRPQAKKQSSGKGLTRKATRPRGLPRETADRTGGQTAETRTQGPGRATSR